MNQSETEDLWKTGRRPPRATLKPGGLVLLLVLATALLTTMVKASPGVENEPKVVWTDARVATAAHFHDPRTPPQTGHSSIDSAKKFVPVLLGKLYTKIGAISVKGDQAVVTATMANMHCTVALARQVGANTYGWMAQSVSCTPSGK